MRSGRRPPATCAGRARRVLRHQRSSADPRQRQRVHAGDAPRPRRAQRHRSDRVAAGARPRHHGETSPREAAPCHRWAGHPAAREMQCVGRTGALAPALAPGPGPASRYRRRRARASGAQAGRRATKAPLEPGHHLVRTPAPRPCRSSATRRHGRPGSAGLSAGHGRRADDAGVLSRRRGRLRRSAGRPSFDATECQAARRDPVKPIARAARAPAAVDGRRAARPAAPRRKATSRQSAAGWRRWARSGSRPR